MHKMLAHKEALRKCINSETVERQTYNKVSLPQRMSFEIRIWLDRYENTYMGR